MIRGAVLEMRSNTAEQLDWPIVAPVPRSEPEQEQEPQDLTASLAGPNGLDLVVELAHDLRSPLTSILFLAEALQQGQGGAVTPEQSRQLGLIYSAALCLCATASDVLELARGGNRLVDRAPAPFSVAETFGSVRSMIEPIAEEKGLALRLVHPVPERRVGHARALSRVLLNLATNAVKFTDTGFVEVAARPIDARRLEFSVRDTGAGIDPVLLRALYQPVRAAATDGRHHFSSSGLGLAICRKLVKAVGATLEVETRPNWGTRFYFEVDCPPAISAP
ncbi:MAG TPA: HAMP domain-containing sensor histidine kinase [Gemmatimonadales bacterium]|nr:HAMP domain-containing sensor histidine kinase [Gemmatimonadales bacterium]